MSLPPWFNHRRQDQNKRSKNQEHRHAKRTGGKVQAGSGSSWRAPEDVVSRTEGFLDQLKTTRQKSYSFSISEWEQIRKNAYEAGLEPRMVIEFEGKATLVVTEQR